MGYFWAAFASIVLILILGGIIGSNIKQRRIRKAREKILPNVTDHIQVNRRYNIFLSHGKTLRNAKVIGISPAHDYNNPLPFPLCEWLIVEKEDGKRAYLKPESVRYYEDVEKEQTGHDNHRIQPMR